MCGLAGAIGFSDASAIVERMTQALAHRGPDDAGVAALTDVAGAPAGAFGHRRLSVIDLSERAHQPMTDATGRFVLVYNGEIYNHEALRAELARDGQVLVSRSDTEVVLQGYIRYGVAFFARLRGMFALAIWDRQQSTLLLARDRFGMKPMYFSRAGGGLLFASEVRALLASQRVPRLLARDAVPAFLQAGALPEPLSAIDGLSLLPAGTALRIAAAGGTIRVDAPQTYATLLARGDHANAGGTDAATRIRHALRDSLRAHLVSDVPIGIFLSGGIDSSVLVALASEIAPEPLRTFTVTFDGQDPGERIAAELIARRFHAQHEVVHLSQAELTDAVRDGIAAMDQPTIDGLNTFIISRAVRKQGIKVVLSGLGADEVFGGYPSFRRALRIGPAWRASGWARGLVARVANRVGGIRAAKIALLAGERTPARASYRSSRALFDDGRIRALCGRALPSLLADAPADLDIFEQVLFYELTDYMRNMLLRDGDVFSMAHGLELRLPFVDADLLAVALSIEGSAKGAGKTLLLRAVGDLLPAEVWNRPKRGFTLPFDAWLLRTMRDTIRADLGGESLRRIGMDARAARDVWDDFERGRLSWSRPWALYALKRWAEHNDVHMADS